MRQLKFVFQRKRKKPWENYRITEKRNKLKYASSQQLSISNAANLSLVKEAKKEHRTTYEKEQSAYLQTKMMRSNLRRTTNNLL